jgi:hypothetical protein
LRWATPLTYGSQDADARRPADLADQLLAPLLSRPSMVAYETSSATARRYPACPQRVGQYPEYPVPACWASHRAALWELGNLHAEWQRVYGHPGDGDLEAALWFHERWLPGTIGRLSRAINSDGAFGCPVHGATNRAYGQRRA